MPGSKRLTPNDVISIAVLVAEALERAGVAYFLGGSLASSYQGEPRATNDIDVVVAMSRGQVDGFVDALGARDWRKGSARPRTRRA